LFFGSLKPMDEFFECENCKEKVKIWDEIGTRNRNHCPNCLYSLHVDLKVSGDRESLCHGLMRPIGLTFKNEGLDKYGNKKQGELMLIHLCDKCGQFSINRISGDDKEDSLLQIFEQSANMDQELKKKLILEKILPLNMHNEAEVKKQLFGITS